jgi:hypothetical protein
VRACCAEACRACALTSTGPIPATSSSSACPMELEGIVSKRLGSRCVSGRSKDWVKFKNPRGAGCERPKRMGPLILNRCLFIRPRWSKTMAREELKWQNIGAEFAHRREAVLRLPDGLRRSR